jgi:dynein light intermediate chain 2
MSKSNSKTKNNVNDLWSIAENLPQQIDIDDGVDTTTIFVGDAGCGKSSMIQSFLKPTATKDPKPTFALEYNFARKKSSSGQNASKSVAHIWELGGDIHEPKLIEIPLVARNLMTTTVIIVIDLSKPQNCLSSLQRWLKLVREVVKKRLVELQAIDPSMVASLREAASARYAENKNDQPRVRPCEIPLYILANKFDTLRSMTLSDRRTIMQLIRFISNYHGATLISTSAAESSMKEAFRQMISNVCFQNPPKVACETSIEKPMYITAGKDDFEQILKSSLVGGEAASTGKVPRLLNTEDEISNFVTAQGITKDCWLRFSGHLMNTFGAPDPSPESASNVGSGNVEGSTVSVSGDDNEFPETEVDEMRAQRDAILQRYIQVSHFIT